jgi:hypothetical protein
MSVTEDAPQTLHFTLCDEESAGRIRVELDAFCRFSDALDQALEQLVARWRHYMPQNAGASTGSRMSSIRG